ncbi:hypothetical protein ACWGJJ_29495, partial [Streptomyces sp. NPDC054787]
MGRHSRKDPAPAPARPRPAPAPLPYEEPPAPYRPEPTVTHQGYVPGEARAGGHPQHHESGGAWGAGPGSGSGSVYGDWRGVPRTPRGSTAVLDGDTPAFGTPAVGFPQVTLDPTPAPTPAPVSVPPAASARDAVTSTGSHRRVPGPRRPVDPVAEQPGSSRGRTARTYTGMAAVAVAAVLAVAVAVQMTSDGDGGGARQGALAAPGQDQAAAAPGAAT